MNKSINFSNFPKNFDDEKKILIKEKIFSWNSLMVIKDKDIYSLITGSRATERNLKRLRCIARLICEIDVSQENAALLMHSGIPSAKALLSLTPQELILKTGRLERILRTSRNPVVDLKKASLWIKKAKEANN
tara:strand:+ start:671 stop:1069 length:399 start_codon:yes stop_codon:yes gene_type:complete